MALLEGEIEFRERSSSPARSRMSNNRKKPAVVVAHPGGQHAHHLAAALQERDMLSHFFHGGTLPKDVLELIPRAKRTRINWFQPIRRLITYGIPSAIHSRLFAAVYDLFDRDVTRRMSGQDYLAVVGYETVALNMFAHAHQRGAAGILDAASVHHSSQTRLTASSNTPSMVRRKDAELAQTDFILTCSTLARDSYRASGFSFSKIACANLGVDNSAFAPSATMHEELPIKFCSAGNLSQLKGFDVVATASRVLQSMGLRYELRIAGNLSTSDATIAKDLSGAAILTGRISHSKMPDFYRTSDVFILPSRFDSFGMVVLEAMACGLPVIVSENVGAKDVVTEGVNGWIIPANDAQALANRMAWCIANPQAVRSMQTAARAAAEARSWSAYRQEVAIAVELFLDDWEKRKHST
ncbi:MAG: glycosyltransferase family 4 protein [Hyphomicrobiaceae bacterium]